MINNNMDISISSPFWKAKINVEEGDVFTIKSEGEAKPFPSKDDPDNKIWSFSLEKEDGTVKSCSLSKTILKELVTEFGKDMEKWIGKKLKAEAIIMYPKGYGIKWQIVK
jgi:hypothetical protein